MKNCCNPFFITSGQ